MKTVLRECSHTDYGQSLFLTWRRGSLSGVELKRASVGSDRHRLSVFTLSIEAESERRLQQIKASMESNSAGSVQYDRWNEDNINMNVEATQSPVMRIYNRLCVGSTGMIMKTAGAIAALVSIYFLGYVTGYYVHRC